MCPPMAESVLRSTADAGRIYDPGRTHLPGNMNQAKSWLAQEQYKVSGPG